MEPSRKAGRSPISRRFQNVAMHPILTIIVASRYKAAFRSCLINCLHPRFINTLRSTFIVSNTGLWDQEVLQRIYWTPRNILVSTRNGQKSLEMVRVRPLPRSQNQIVPWPLPYESVSVYTDSTIVQFVRSSWAWKIEDSTVSPEPLLDETNFSFEKTSRTSLLFCSSWENFSCRTIRFEAPK